ncbi:hypothetical protein [Microseira wollei]|uniref:Uncharacterized protein n=1 Tax=Microseira wollei NIES-4236 TaxID=2530354 RepID=A0AAV3XGH3_9CYAN|nr:hypothetical protein [Microseira wollei]GET40985.1 hypothetical protein MiSe_57970 [Microseira wollei NIES-4236]
MGRKYIIFRADWQEEQGAENRLLAHTGACTDILAEHFDSSNRPIPQPGYRVPQFHNIPAFDAPQFPGTSTYWCRGNWEVVRVEQYPTGATNSEFEMVVICYCQYSPIQAEQKPIKPIDATQSAEKTTAFSGG